MPWVRIDDAFTEHPKVSRLSDSAVALFVAGLCYCNRNLTDGFIPSQVGLGQLRYCDGNAVPVISELEEAGLWEANREANRSGWWVHDYENYQPSRAEVLAEREHKKVIRAMAGRQGGINSGVSRRSKREANAKQKGSPVPVPVPISLQEN